MQSVQWSSLESEAQQLQTNETARPAASVTGKQASSEKEQSDRQHPAEAMYTAFVWLFGAGCY